MKVELTYFKPLTGKFYSNDSYETSRVALYEIWDEVQQMRVDGKLPGLAPFATQFTILINVPGHEHEHPKLLPYYAVEPFDERFVDSRRRPYTAI